MSVLTPLISKENNGSVGMIIGDPSVIALEYEISQAYEELSFLALGFFVIHVSGQRYGVYSHDSTMLACLFDEVERRFFARGTHVAPFASDGNAGEIADSIRQAIYSEQQKENYFGYTPPDFRNLIYSHHLIWAPDGDEAFDDGSFVLHFDIDEWVRVIAFKCRESNIHDPDTLTDRWVEADDFYNVLQRWSHSFKAEWSASPKL